MTLLDLLFGNSDGDDEKEEEDEDLADIEKIAFDPSESETYDEFAEQGMVPQTPAHGGDAWENVPETDPASLDDPETGPIEKPWWWPF